jgi:hypothetical protein
MSEKIALIRAALPHKGGNTYVWVAFVTADGPQALKQNEFLEIIIKNKLKMKGYTKLMSAPKPPSAGRYNELKDSYPPGAGILLHMEEVKGETVLEFPFVLYMALTSQGEPALTNDTNMGDLQKLLNDGWEIGCQEVLSEERADGISFQLIKMTKTFK